MLKKALITSACFLIIAVGVSLYYFHWKEQVKTTLRYCENRGYGTSCSPMLILNSGEVAWRQCRGGRFAYGCKNNPTPVNKVIDFTEDSVMNFFITLGKIDNSQKRTNTFQYFVKYQSPPKEMD